MQNLKLKGLIFLRLVVLIFTLVVLVQCNNTPKQFTFLSAEETGLNFRNDIVESQHNNILTYEYAYNGAGIAAGDINNDGLTDLYFSGNDVENKIFLNRGDWKFEDVTRVTGMAGRSGWKTGVTMADVNGDGWLDIYVCYSGNAPGEGYNKPVIKDHPQRANQLFINSGCKPGQVPVFIDSAKAYGLDAPGTFSTQSYFFDYDRDGDLDVFLLNHANMFYAAFFNTDRLRNLRHPYFGNALYRNDSNKFTNVSDDSGLHGSGLNFGLGTAITDLNFDGWPDLYVTNDYDEQDFCYVNNRNGTFKEVSHTLFDHLSKFGMGVDVADINNDGLQEIIVLDMLPEDNHRQKLLRGPDEYDRYTLAVDSGYHHQYMRNTLQLNRGFAQDSLPRFSEIGQLAGISNTDWSWAPLVIDLDNDGLKDIFITNGFPRDYNNLDFIKYTGNIYQEAKTANKKVNYLDVVHQLPSTKLSNYVFRNTGGTQFENVSKDWGLTRMSVSNGAVYADLDNDGDYDIVTNNLNDQAGIFRNNQEQLQKNNYIKIKLKGNGRNTYAIGAKLWARAGEKNIFQEVYFGRGYESSVEPLIIVGVGQATIVDEIKVEWPDGSVSVAEKIPVGQLLVLDQKNSTPSPAKGMATPNATFLTDITSTSGIDFTHRENKFIDFKTQRLLLYQLSRLGGKMATGDVDGDGNEDVFFGGAHGQRGELFFGKQDGSFHRLAKQPWHEEKEHEDTDALFFDADGDHDQDIYVVSGGNEFPSNSTLYQDRLYLNNGSNGFSKATEALPRETSSGSCVAAADFDKDGDLDLFVGGRHAPLAYGLIPRSFIYRNDSREGIVKFTDVTTIVNADIANVGMVTDALWTDYNNDSLPDLIITGEWMPIRVYKNNKGHLVEETDLHSLSQTYGWWTSIYAADVDGDGDTDYFFGNAGANLQFKPTPDEPVELFASDYNNDGSFDPLLCYYIQGETYPMHSRDELLEQMTSLRKKFTSYASYADAKIVDVAGDVQLEKAYRFQAFTLKSSWLENNQGHLTLRALPAMAQLSCVNGYMFEDFNGDGNKELLIAGNFFPYRVQLGRSDASKGLLLTYHDGNFIEPENMRSNVWLSGDIRDIALLTSSSGVKRVVVSRNNDAATVHSFSWLTKPGIFKASPPVPAKEVD